MALYFTCDRFPSSGEIKDATGLPWGCIVQPLADFLPSTLIPSNVRPTRCASCFAYINPYVRFSRKTWKCSLCRSETRTEERYMSQQDRLELAELNKAFVEYDLGDDDESSQTLSAGVADAGDSKGEVKHGHVPVSGASTAAAAGTVEHTPDTLSLPAYILLVDLSGRSEYVELIKTSLLAALEALPASCAVGLLVFSTKLGVFDLRSAVPHVRYTRIPREAAPCGVGIADLVALEDLLVPLAKFRDNVCAALESLASHAPPEADEEGARSGLGLGDAKESKGSAAAAASKLPGDQRGFGAALTSLLDCLAARPAGAPPLHARVLTFLAGLPNYGLGALHDRASDASPLSLPLLQEAAGGFYRKLGERAARAGVCFDLFAISELRYVDLASLKYLTLLTGGNLLLYEELEECALPQDLFRQFKKPQAFRGLLRVRTSPEFQVGSVFGHLIPDKNYENLYHIAGCDPRKTFALDFEFTSGSGFSSYYGQQPVVQLAFAYSMLVRDGGSDGGEGDSKDGSNGGGAAGSGRERLVRRLRVHTRKIDVARDPLQLYQNVQPEIVVAQLTHQIVHASLTKGVQEARLLVKDWLVNLTACYNEAVLFRDKPKASATLETIDTSFGKVEGMQFLSRFIFSLLKNPILGLNHVHPDVRVFTQCLYSALEPGYLAKALYPTLASFADAGTMVHRALFLTKAAMEGAGTPIFLMDTLTGIYVLYIEKAADMAMPPPQDSEVRKIIKKIKARAPLLTPRVAFARVGEPQARFFVANLLEEADSAGFSYAQFAESVAGAVVMVLRS